MWFALDLRLYFATSDHCARFVCTCIALTGYFTSVTVASGARLIDAKRED